MNKKILIPIIIVLVIVLIAGGVFAYMYFGTDTFRSNKELFGKYLMQNEEILDNIDFSDLNTYKAKQKNVEYRGEGSIKANVILNDSTEAETVNALKNFSITFVENIDRPNNYEYENINVNYSDSQSLNLELVKKEDVFAVKINDVLNKYIGIENNNLKELAKKIGLEEEALNYVPDKIKLDDLINLKATESISNMISEDEIKTIKDKYFGIIVGHLTDEMFSKEQVDNKNVYTLKITALTANEILKDVLTNLKDDELIMNKIRYVMINSIGLTEEDYNKAINETKSSIEEMIENTDFTIKRLQNRNDEYDNETANESLLIKLYSQNNKLLKTEISMDSQSISLSKNNNGIGIEFTEDGETISMQVQKISTVDNVKYSFKALKGIEELASLQLEYIGINTDEVTETAEMSISSEGNKLVYNFTNTKKFGTDILANKVNNSEIQLLNSAPNGDSIMNLYNQVVIRLQQVNDSKIKAAGLQGDKLRNILMYYVPAIIPVAINYSINGVLN